VVIGQEQTLGAAVLKLGTDNSGLIAGIGKAKTAAAGLQLNFNKVADSLTRVGKKLTHGLTLPLIGFATAATKMSGDFEAALAKITGLVGVSRDQVGAWRDDLLSMSTALGRGPKKLADAMFFITSAGLRGAVAMDTLRASTKASVAGLGEIETVADAATSALNAYGSENISASEAVDVLVATVREGKAAADAIAGSIGRVIPLASQMGVSFNQVGGVIAALTRIGFSADESVTSLQAVLSGLLKPTKEAEDALRAAGLSASGLRAAIRENGLLTTLNSMYNALGRDEAKLAQVIPNVRALRGALGLLGENAEEATEIMAEMADVTGDTDKAFSEMTDTINQKFAKAIARIQTAFIRIGDVLKPVIIPMMDRLSASIERIGKNFSQMSSGMQHFFVVAGMAAISLGPLMLAFGQIIKLVRGLALALKFLVLNPVFGIAAVVAALGLLIGQYVLWKKRQNELTRVLNANNEIMRSTKIRINEITTAEGELADEQLRRLEILQATQEAELIYLLTVREQTEQALQGRGYFDTNLGKWIRPSQDQLDAFKQELEVLDKQIDTTESSLDLIDETIAGVKRTTKATDEQSTSVDNAKKTWKQWNTETLQSLKTQFAVIDKTAALERLVGNTYDVRAEKIEVVQDAIKTLMNLTEDEVDEVYSAQDKSIRGLLELLEVLRVQGDATIETFEDLRNLMPMPQKSGSAAGEWFTQGPAGKAGARGAPIAPTSSPADLSGFAGLGQMGSALAGGGSGIGIAISAFTAAAMSIQNFAAVMNPINTMLEATVQIIGPGLNVALEPLVRHIQFFGQLVGGLIVPVLQELWPVFDIISGVLSSLLIPQFQFLSVPLSVFSGLLELLEPILKAVAVALEVLMAPVKYIGDIFEWLGKGIKAFGEQLSLILQGKFKKAKDVSGPGAFSSDAFSGLADRIADIWNADYGATAFEKEQLNYPQYGGMDGPTFEQQRPITVDIDVHDNSIYGEGARELAIIIRDEFESLGVLGL